MVARRFVYVAAPSIAALGVVALGLAQFGAWFCQPLRAQGREKRVTPVDAAQRATFERERKVGVAILVGIGQYPRYSGLGDLRYPTRDADLLETELSTQRYVVTSLKDTEATRGAILNAIRQAGEVIDAEHGTFVFFFSGHGFAEGNTNFLASYDAASNDLAHSGLDLQAVEKAMIASGVKRRVMYIDACRNEPGKGAGDGRSFSRFESSSGTRILFSTKAGRISYEDDELKQGLFTYYLSRGLHGEAARDDGLVSFRDLADYVVDGVERRSLKQGHVQVPYEAGESSGDFLLARAASVAIVAKPPALTPSDPTFPRDKFNGNAARVSYKTGDVSIRRGNSDDLVAAITDAALNASDRLVTAANGRAEVQFDSSHLGLSLSTDIRLNQVDDRGYQIQIAAGTAILRFAQRSEAAIEVSTPSVTLRPLQPGVYRVSVLPDGTSQLSVRLGDAEIFTPRGSEPLHVGEAMLARGPATNPEYQRVSPVAQDDFERWCLQRERGR
jgi:hypothetical protein